MSGILALGLKSPYLPRVLRPERVLAITVGVEAAFTLYAAMLAFITPTGAHQHNPLLAVVLLGIAVPLAWYAVNTALNLVGLPDPLRLRVIIPNCALLGLCLNGSLISGSQSHALLPALVAAVALVIVAGTIWLMRSRLSGGSRPVRS